MVSAARLSAGGASTLPAHVILSSTFHESYNHQPCEEQCLEPTSSGKETENPFDKCLQWPRVIFSNGYSGSHDVLLGNRELTLEPHRTV